MSLQIRSRKWRTRNRRPVSATQGPPRSGKRPSNMRAGSPDGGVLTATAILVSIGMMMIFSTTADPSDSGVIPPYFLRHAGAVGLAAILAYITFRMPTVFWRRVAPVAWVSGALMLALTLVVGVEVNGSVRWLEIPGTGLRFQPAEFVKLSTVIIAARLLAAPPGNTGVSTEQIRQIAMITAIPALLLLAQPDLGNAALLVSIVAVLVFAAGAPLRPLLMPGLVAAGGVSAFVYFNAYARRRVTGFLEPWERAGDEGFQLVQSFVAFGRGGSFGVGLGDGRQKLGFLPEAHTDFILSTVAEELGLAGVLLVLGAFTALGVAGLRIASRCPDRHAALIALGMTSLLVIPASVNAAVVMGMLPTTGFTLPMLSYGRTSLLICGIAVGVLLRTGASDGSVAITRRRAPQGLSGMGAS
ncbi:putative lipid II flippase FtsW [Myxococcota bacterium]|nr:putative lipid II flippase FtsW [Myxococcota bacterium]